MGGATSTLSIVIRAIDDASAQLAGVFNGVETKASEAQMTVSELGMQMTIAGAAMVEIGSKVTVFMQSVVAAGTQGVTASESLTTTLSSLVSTAQQDTVSKEANLAATQKLNAQKATLTAQIRLEEEALTKATAKYGENSPQVAAAEAKLLTYQASLQKVDDSLNQHTALLNLAGASVADLSKKFTEAADANVHLGFNVEDSLRSFQSLMQATHDVTQSMNLNALAMNLARDKQEDLGTATNQVVQILEGGGRAAKQFGINMSQTATPAEALAQLTQMLGGQAQAYADGPAGKAAIAQAEWNKTMEDAGTTILPIIDGLIQKIGGLVAWVDAFIEAHPKLAQAILVGIAVFGGLLLVLGSVMLIVAPLLIAFGTMGGIVAVAVMGIIAGIAILATLVTLVASNWKTMKSDAEEFWNGLVTLITNVVNNIEGIVKGFLTNIQTAFNTVTSLINSIRSAAGSVGSVVSGGMSSMLSMVPHFATGGIVNGPTMALVGEAGPEAIIPLSAFAGGSSLRGAGGSGGNIVININGGNYLDSNGATMIANAIAKQVGRQLKVSNYN
jgi:hypothetical protein